MAEEEKLTALQVLPALESGGVERGTLEVGKYLVEHGHRSIVMSAGGRLVEQLLREGSEHVAWDIGRKRLSTLRLVLRLRRFLVDNHVDILHVRSRMPAWVCYMAWKGMEPENRPHFVTTVHGMYSVNPYSAVMLRGEVVIAVSDTVRDYILREFPDTPADRIHVIPRGVDGAAYPYGWKPDAAWQQAFFADFPQGRGKLLLTLPGRITRLKGHEDFIRLVAGLKRRGLPVHGMIVGGASASKQRYLAELRQQVRDQGLESDISFTGQRSDLKNILAISNLALSLSNQPESFGRTTLEALRLGVPTAGYDHGGVGEILRAIYPGGLLPLGNAGAALDKIAALLRQPNAVPEGDFYPLSEMLKKTMALYLQQANATVPCHP
jgi:glycosyltransferase involved in cell wall biosynthesis